MSGGTALFIQNRDLYGALLVHLPLLHALQRMPEGKPLVVYSPFAGGKLFESLGLAQETRIWTRTKGAQPAPESALRPGLTALVSELRARRYHRIVSLRPQSADVTTAIAASGATERIGYRTSFSRLVLTSTTPRNTRIYRALNFLNLLRVADREALLRESIAALARTATGKPPAPAGSYCLIPCGHQTTKLWGESNYLALAQALAARDPDARFLLVLGERERGYAGLFERAGLGQRTSVLVAAGVPELARAVLEARVVVANDCGPSHVALLGGAPLVSIHENADGAVQRRLDEWFHPQPGARCVTTESPAPIESIGVEAVLAEIERLLANPHAPGGVVFSKLARYAISSRTTLPDTSVSR